MRCQAAQRATIDDGTCFALLRRALEADDATAWQAFEQQFGPLFYHWLQQDLTHFGIPWQSIDELEELWADARSRFVTRYGTQGRLTTQFDHIGAVLKVLQKCIRSAVQEERRTRDRQRRLVTAMTDLSTQTTPSLQQEVPSPGTQIELDELRHCITHQLEQDVPEPELRQLLIWRYVEDLKPREISARHPQLYASTDDVHKALERVMKRLRRRIDQYIARCL